MEYRIRHLSVSEVTKLSHILKNYSCEALIKTGKYCIDGKSILGLLSAMENKDLPIILEINELSQEDYQSFGTDIAPFVESGN